MTWHMNNFKKEEIVSMGLKGESTYVGFVNTGIQWAFPHAYDDLKDWAYKKYDEVGEGLNTIKNVASDFIKNPIGTWNKGADLSKEISKCSPKLPRSPRIGFG